MTSAIVLLGPVAALCVVLETLCGDNFDADMPSLMIHVCTLASSGFRGAKVFLRLSLVRAQCDNPHIFAAGGVFNILLKFLVFNIDRMGYFAQVLMRQVSF